MSLGPLAQLDKAVKDEMACSLAVMALFDDKSSITAAKILEITKAAGVTVESYVPKQLEGALSGADINSVVSVGGGAGDAAPAAEAPAADTKKEDKKAGETLPSLFLVFQKKRPLVYNQFIAIFMKKS